MTLSYNLDPDILPLDLHTKIQVHTSVFSAARVVTPTHGKIDDTKTIMITPVTSEMWGVKLYT